MTLAALGALLCGPQLAAQDAIVLLPVDSIEFLLAHGSFQAPEKLEGTRFAKDRTQRVPLWFSDGTGVLVKWAAAPPGGDATNNSPRYELAAYALQKLFLDEAEFVVPPTAPRVVPAKWYQTLGQDITATFPGAESVLVVLQYFLFNVTDENVFDEGRLEADTAYARTWGNANILTYLIRHNDSNEGNLLISTAAGNPRVLAVDNGLAFNSELSDRGIRWRSLQTDRLPRHTVDRLRRVTRDQLERALGVLAQFEIRGTELVRVPPATNLQPGQGVRTQGGVVQLGLTDAEIDGVWSRIEDLLSDVDQGKMGTFMAGGPA